MAWVSYRTRVYPLLGVSALIFCLLLPSKAIAQETIRVGIHQNPPLSYITSGGRPEGFVVGVLNDIARTEGWTLDYVVCGWNECNQLLSLGEVHMVVPMSANEARQRRLDFNRESLYVNWGQIVMEGRDEIKTPLDLEGKTVVVRSSDTHFADLKELAKRFDIQVRFLEVEDYESVLAWVDRGPVDAGLVNRSVNTKLTGSNRLNKSSVIFNPAEIRVAFSPLNGQLNNAKRIQRLDYRLTQLKGNPDSIYYRLQRQWFNQSNDFELPWWLAGTLVFIGLLTGFLALGIVLLRRQVHLKTGHLREANEQFAAFMNNLPGIAYMKGVDGRYVFVNSAWQKFNGLSNSQVEARLASEIWPERSLASLGQAEQSAVNSGAAVDSQERHPWGESPSDWQVTHFPIHDPDGKVAMVGGVGIDVTAQREAERALTTLNQQQQMILESAADGIIGLNGTGRCTFVNHAALEMLSYQLDELLGEKFHDRILHSTDAGEAYSEISSPVFQAHQLGRRFSGERGTFWGGEGSALEVEYSANPISGGGLMGAVVIFRALNELDDVDLH